MDEVSRPRQDGRANQIRCESEVWQQLQNIWSYKCKLTNTEFEPVEILVWCGHNNFMILGRTTIFLWRKKTTDFESVEILVWCGHNNCMIFCRATIFFWMISFSYYDKRHHTLSIFINLPGVGTCFFNVLIAKRLSSVINRECCL